MSEDASFSLCRSSSFGSSVSSTEESFVNLDTSILTEKESTTFDNGNIRNSRISDLWLPGYHVRSAEMVLAKEHVIVQFKPGSLLQHNPKPNVSPSIYQDGNNALNFKSSTSSPQIANATPEDGRHLGGILDAGSMSSNSSTILEDHSEVLSSNTSAGTHITGFSKLEVASDSGSVISIADQLSVATRSSLGSLGGGFVHISLSDRLNTLLCNTCKCKNTERAIFCVACYSVLSAIAHLEMDAQIAINLQQKEEDFATLSLLEREKKRRLLPLKSAVAQASFFRGEIQMNVQGWSGFSLVPPENLESQAMGFIAKVLSNGDGWKVKVAFVFTSKDPRAIRLVEQGGFRLLRPIRSGNYVQLSTSVDKAWDIFTYGSPLNSLERCEMLSSSAATGWLVAVPLKMPLGDLISLRVHDCVDPESILPLVRFDASKRKDEDIRHLQHALETACTDFFEMSLGLNPHKDPGATRKRRACGEDESSYADPKGEFHFLGCL